MGYLPNTKTLVMRKCIVCKSEFISRQDSDRKICKKCETEIEEKDKRENKEHTLQGSLDGTDKGKTN